MDLTVLWEPQLMPYGKDWNLIIDTRAWLLQCKLGGYMRPAEREELIELAKRYGCRPVLVGRKPYTFFDLVTGGQIEPPDSVRSSEAAR